MLIHNILNVFVDMTSVITVPLYLRFLWIQLKTTIYASDDSLTPGFTILLLCTGWYDIFYTIVDLVFVELPRWGISFAWLTNKGIAKFTMITKNANAPQHLLITLVLAVNRYTAVKLPFKYKYIWTTSHTIYLSILIWISLVIYHIPLVLFCEFESCLNCFNTTGIRYVFVTSYNYWNEVYTMALFGFSLVMLLPSIFFYGVAGHYIYTHSAMFKENTLKFGVLKLTAASFVPGIGTLLITILLAAVEITWIAFEVNLFPIDTFDILLRLFIEIKNLSLPWIVVILFEDIRAKMFPFIDKLPFLARQSTVVSAPTILVNHN